MLNQPKHDSLPLIQPSADAEMHCIIQHIKHRNYAAISKWTTAVEDINMTDYAGNTALHWAAQQGMGDVVEMLLRRGAAPNIQNSNGATALHCAASLGVEAVISALLRAGSDPTLKNRRGRTFMDMCRAKGHVHLDYVIERIEKSVESGKREAQLRSGSTDARQLGTDGSCISEEATGLSSSLRWASPSPVKPKVDSDSLSHNSDGPHTTTTEAAPIVIPSGASHASTEFLHRIDKPRQGTQPPLSAKSAASIILCSFCEDILHAGRAVAICEECNSDGGPIWFCEECWRNEHSSKKTRHHKRKPVPTSALPTKVLPPVQSFPGLSDDARALIMLQQQTLQLLALHQMNGSKLPLQPDTSAVSTQTPPQPQLTNHAVQTYDDQRNAFFSEAVFQLNEIREQLEAEVHHSNTLIDGTRLQLLESLELKHRAEVEAQYWKRLVGLRRPPEVLVVFHPSAVPRAYSSLPRQHAHEDDYAKIILQAQHAAPQKLAQPPEKKYRNATCDRAVQTEVLMVPSTTQTEASAPTKRFDGGVLPRYAIDAVEVVHGEKHLPGQPQMLLVRWVGGEEDWVPAHEVAHCAAVVAYLSRYDKSYSNLDDSISGQDLRVGSPLGDTERNSLIAQLAQLKRMATANASRDGDREPRIVTFLEQALHIAPQAQQHQQTSGVQPPLSPSSKPKESDAVEIESADNDDSAAEDELMKKYDERLRALEIKYRDGRKNREEYERRIAELRVKQQLIDENKRKDVHREYERKRKELELEQPQLNHPLSSTTDRHAALILHELQEEVQVAERAHHRQKSILVTGESRKQACHTPHESPPVPRRDITNPRQGTLIPQPVQEKQAAPAPSREPPGMNPVEEAHHQITKQNATVGGEVPTSFEQRLNRILYEQYFYTKAASELDLQHGGNAKLKHLPSSSS